MEHIPEPESGLTTAAKGCGSGVMYCGASFVILIVVLLLGSGMGYYGAQMIAIVATLVLLIGGMLWSCRDR
ncbi:MAG: hypothetical protein ACW98U_13100 [Candidatus Thorarchaeota archaeon]|jgi:hypothetical protein